MYRKLLVGYAADRHGEDALSLARVLASAESVAEVLIVEARHESRFGTADGGARRAAAERRLAPTTIGWPAHVDVSARVVAGQSPAAALSATADQEGADVLVLGSSHRGFAGRVLIGTTASSI